MLEVGEHAMRTDFKSEIIFIRKIGSLHHF